MPQTINVKVERVRFHDPKSGYTVVIGSDEETRAAVTVVGTFAPVEIDESIAVVGEWYVDRRYGRQFRAESVSVILPTSAEGIRAYLAEGYVAGIGSALAARLVETFGTDLLRVIDEEPERLLAVPGIGKRKLQKITASWNEQHGVRRVMMFLASHGLGGAKAFHIQKQYGDDAIGLIRENPYQLAAEIRGIGFATADEIARKLGHDTRSPFRLMAGLRHVMDVECRQRGHCGMPAELLTSEMIKLLDIDRNLAAETIGAAVSQRVLIEENMHGQRVVFEPWLHRAESRIAETLTRLAREAPRWSGIEPEEAIRAVEAESGISLDPVQRRAVSLALKSRAVVITGGPGVGKTTLVRALLTVFRGAELTVAMAAPTGRAAKRMQESAGSAAVTIHRLLEMSPQSGEFQRNAGNPLETDVVILDEASMIDVPLFDAVLEAVPPDGGIVIVGDADQLPSVGPGQVLHDLLESQRVPSIRLTEIHRQAEGSDIVQNAHRINHGEMPIFGTQSAGSNMFFFPVQSPENAAARVVDLVTNRIPEKFGLRSRDVQVLAPMWKRTAGVDALNRELQNALNAPSRHTARVERPGGVFFCPGDKLMQTENNYDKGVFNGDIGVVATVDVAKEVFTVDFGGELIADYAFSEADQLTLAYAATIHKSQGSEYLGVVIVLLPQYQIMLRRNLLYTAVTRGRRLVVVVGDTSSVQTAVKTGRGGERCTRLRECLQHA